MKADEHIRIRERMLLDAWRAGIRLDGVVNGVYSLDDLHRVQALLLAAGDDDGVDAVRDCIAGYPAAAAQRDADEARRAALRRRGELSD